MKHVNILLALSLAACSSGATSSYLPGKTANGTAAATSDDRAATVRGVVNRASTQKYIYVGDAKNDQLLVYPQGVSNPSPIRTVPLGDSPNGIAVDGSGHVFVALWNTSTVAVFSRGATSLVRTISTGIYKPTGVAVDENNVLYVASHCQTVGQPAYVAEFEPGSDTPDTTQLVAAQGDAIDGVAVRNDVAFLDVDRGAGGLAILYSKGQPTQVQIGLAVGSGLALDNAGNLYAANAATLSEFAPPSYQNVHDTYYGTGAGIRYVGRGGDGTIYAPYGSPKGTTPTVVVTPTNGQPSYTITDGLSASSPSGAAAD